MTSSMRSKRRVVDSLTITQKTIETYSVAPYKKTTERSFKSIQKITIGKISKIDNYVNINK